VLLIAIALVWPPLVRHLLIAQIQLLTHRPVSIESVHVNPLTGRVALKGLRLLDRDGRSPFADFERLDVSVRPLSALRGHLSIRDAVLEGPVVRVVRSGEAFNFDDLVESSGSGGRVLDVTVDHFVLRRGTVTLEDRALSQPQTWRSEQIEIEVRNLSTRRDDGTATATSVTAGAPVRIVMRNMRLYPIHLVAEVVTEGFDLSLARLYLPPDAPVNLDRGRASSTLHVTLDAKEGVSASATGTIENVVLMRAGESDPAAIVPKVTLDLKDLIYRDDKLGVARLELIGSASVRDPTASKGARLQVSTLRASITDATWPITSPGQLTVQSSVPGGGQLSLTGQLNPPPATSQLRLRLARVDLAPWTRLVPMKPRVDGVAEADLRVDHALTPGAPSRVQGQVAVNRIAVRDGNRELLAAQRVEASGLEVHWPSRVNVKQVVVTGPRATIERDKAGGFPLQALLGPELSPAEGSPAAPRTSQAPSTGPIALTLDEVIVKDGALAWRDDAVTPRAALDFRELDVKVSGGVWPLHGPLNVQASVIPPRGGVAQVAGRVGVDPLTADVRLNGQEVDLAPYQPYLPVPASIRGRANLDLAVVLPPSPKGSLTARGTAALSQVDVRDGERTVMRVERVAATGLDVDWPRRVIIRDLRLQQPWTLFERDRAGALTLRELLSPRTTQTAVGAKPTSDDGSPNRTAPNSSAVPVTVGHVAVEEGGARIVDHRVAPPFAIDLTRLTGQVEGLSTDPTSKSAQLEFTGRAGVTSILTLRGTVGPLVGPLHLDVNGDLRGFAVPRTNSYLVEHVAWEARDGWLSTMFRCRIDGDSLDAKTEIALSRLQVARAAANDQAQARIGLPLGMIIALMKDSHGDIRVTLPISGRLSDPRFDMSEAIWSTVRNVAVKAITAPVSWIGRVQLDSHSRIQRIDIDPIPFAPGRATLTPEAQEHVTRVAAFLEKTPAMRMALTPVVSPRDRAALGRKAVDVQVSRVAGDEKLSPEAAAARLFKERFPQTPVPDSLEAMLSALAVETAPSGEVKDLAADRLKAVRDGIKKAGIDGKRLKDDVAPALAAAGDGEVKLDLVEPESPGLPERPTFFKRLLGNATPEPSSMRN